MKVYEVTLEKGTNPCLEKDLPTIIDMLKDCDIDDEITIKVIEMSEEEFKALPDWDGP